ncbi:MAG: metallophosphoesterase family protein [Chloroflexota bacterium]
MRVAIFSDIHGNSVGLDAVLADIEAKGGVDHYWVLGDHVASGPDPAGVMERLLALPSAEFIRGNTDRYISNGDRVGPTAEDVAKDPSRLPIMLEIEGNFSWTTGIMAELGWINWLEALPFEVSQQLPSRALMQGIHCSPWSDDDMVGFCPLLSDVQIKDFAQACSGDLIFCGHTHWPWDVTIGDKRIINVGSVGLSTLASIDACWTLVTADSSGYEIEQFEVPFNRQAVIDLTKAKHQPGVKFISDGYSGKHTRPWKRERQYEVKSSNH